MRRFGRLMKFGGNRPYLTAVMMTAVLVAIPLVVGALELGEPKFQDRQVVRTIARRMRLFHLSNQDMDDEISQRGLKLYLKSLDPSKLYFYQSDVDEFSAWSDKLDDLAKAGDLSFAFSVFNRFVQRIDERLVVINQLIESDHDFSVDESLVTDADDVSYAKTPEELKDRWRKRIKYSLLVLKTEETSDEEARDKLHRRYNSFAKRMKQFDEEEVTELFLTSLTTAYDPHSTYFSKSTFDNFMIQMRLNLEGIGASLQSEDGVTVVKRIVPGGAADTHGKLKVEDRVVSVGQGESGEMVDVADMKLDDVVALIRGAAGTVVRLGVMPEGTSEIKTYSIVREKIELKDSEAQGEIFEAGKKSDGTAYRIGVIDLPSFYSDMEGARLGLEDYKSTTRDVRNVLESFKRQGVDAVVLDLRSNGGGSLPESVDCTGLFIDKGPVVQVKDSAGDKEQLDDETQGMSWDGPLVVLTSKFSASASEILAGAIQDYKRGLIVGDTATHGKGTVQQLRDVGRIIFPIASTVPQDYGALKVTMQQFYRPSGDSTQMRGVLADVILPSISDHMDVGESDLQYALEFDQIEKAKFDAYPFVSSDLVAELREKSAERIKGSDDFIRVNSDIKRYMEQKQRKTVTLNEAKFLEHARNSMPRSKTSKLWRNRSTATAPRSNALSILMKSWRSRWITSRPWGPRNWPANRIVFGADKSSIQRGPFHMKWPPFFRFSRIEVLATFRCLECQVRINGSPFILLLEPLFEFLGGSHSRSLSPRGEGNGVRGKLGEYTCLWRRFFGALPASGLRPTSARLGAGGRGRSRWRPSLIATPAFQPRLSRSSSARVSSG